MKKKLNNDLNGEFKIVMRDGEKLKLDHDLNLPVAQHFKMRIIEHLTMTNNLYCTKQ